MIHKTIEPFLPEVLNLFEKHKIKNAYLFGSILTNWFSEQSDIDILVNMQEDLDPVESGGHLWDLIYDLECLLQRKVEVLTERSLKNPYFIQQLEKTKFQVYGN